ncbi:HDOD domain protein [Rubripirellula lacrimiformis]|uniref:HDOD domain protein n=1 Tax=Rubripirellula lacrimiformis TaxID=1930273 RepID=A0A517NIZ7_9BACT|nr:HDOD domain-containing protein [Rubripirellula lacrimiformis]QDT07102.1 HDOD domain protein [Rubripirellula lacrimiformis]
MNAVLDCQDVTNDLPLAVDIAIEKIRNLATLPTVATQIIEMAACPDTGLNELHAIINGDPALGTRILKLANSAFYGVPRQIDSLDRAVVMLGMNAIKNTAIAASLHKVFRSSSTPSALNPRDLWLHSVAVAVAAKQLAITTRTLKSDVAFLAGLIHDIGIMVEMQAYSIRFGEWAKSIATPHENGFLAAEQEFWGATHQDFGAGLCRKWNFPFHLELATRYHHCPDLLPEDQRLLPTIIHVADIIAVRMDAGFTGTVDHASVHPSALKMLGLSDQDVDDLAATLPEELSQAITLLGS